MKNDLDDITFELPGDYQHLFEAIRRAHHGGALTDEDLRIAEKLMRDTQESMGSLARRAFEVTHDQLTRLLNAKGLEHRFREAQANFARNPIASNYLGALDLDNFKQVNDTYGHAAGDEALRLTAKYLREAVKETDAVARLHGDEFAILAYRVGPPMRSRTEIGFEPRELFTYQDEAARALFGRVASHVNAGMQRYIVDLGGTAKPVGASIGAVRVMEHNSFDETLAHADHQLYLAKGRGKGHAVVKTT